MRKPIKAGPKILASEYIRSPGEIDHTWKIMAIVDADRQWVEWKFWGILATDYKLRQNVRRGMFEGPCTHPSISACQGTQLTEYGERRCLYARLPPK